LAEVFGKRKAIHGFYQGELVLGFVVFASTGGVPEKLPSRCQIVYALYDFQVMMEKLVFTESRDAELRST
jgi:hypothetical protein